MRLYIAEPIRQRGRVAGLVFGGLTVVLCVINANVVLAQPPTGRPTLLGIDSVRIDANSAVEFDIKPLGGVPYSSIAREPFLDVQTQGEIRAEIDRSSMKTDPVTRVFSFHVYLNKSSLFTQSVYEYEVDEDPSGVFNDTIQSINLHIGREGSTVVNGTVKVPLHSPYGPSNPFDLSTLNVRSLRTGSPTSFTVPLKSNLQLLGASLGSPSATASCDSCLKAPISVQLSTDRIRPGDTVNVSITTVPNLWKAMAASSHPNSDKYDATLNIVIPLAAEGGTQWPQTVPIPIKFSPAPLIVTVSVIGGVLIGAFLRALLLFFSSKKWSWPEFTVGSITATLTWLISMLIWSGDTSVKLFGLTFDPTQIASAFILCILAGGGPALLKLLESYFPQLKTNR